VVLKVGGIGPKRGRGQKNKGVMEGQKTQRGENAQPLINH